MQRALLRFETCMSSRMATLCWVAGAALEALEQAGLELTPARKRLFSQLDREIKRHAASHEVQINDALLRELLYLVALADSSCMRCQDVARAYQLPDPGFTEIEIQDAFARLRGPGIDVMH